MGKKENYYSWAVIIIIGNQFIIRYFHLGDENIID